MKKLVFLFIIAISFFYRLDSAYSADLNSSWLDGKINTSNITSNSAYLSWSVGPSDSVITSFQLYQNGNLIATIRDTKYTVTNLNSSTTYNFKIEAGDETGNWSTNGPSINVNTNLGSGLPIDPNADTIAPNWLDGYISKTDISQTSATLTWDGATDNIKVTNYRIYDGDDIIATTTRETVKLSGLTADKTYSIKIEAGDEDGNWSTNGPHIYLTTLKIKSNPYWTNGTLVAKNITQSSITLTWSGAKDNIAVTKYKVFKNITFIKTISDTTIEITELSPDTNYDFQVEAGDASGNWSTNGPRQQFKTLGIAEIPLENNFSKPTNKIFKDIAGHWAENSILELYAKGIINGVTKDTFAPSRYVTRAEFATMVVKALNLTSVNYKQIFNDVSNNDWFATAVTTASQYDIMTGSANKFYPQHNITREEIASVLIRAIKNKRVQIDKDKVNYITNLSNASAWAREAIQQAVEIGLITGDTSKQIKPLANATRAESVLLLKRLIGISTTL